MNDTYVVTYDYKHPGTAGSGSAHDTVSATSEKHAIDMCKANFIERFGKGGYLVEYDGNTIDITHKYPEYKLVSYSNWRVTEVRKA